jgi:ATP-dependent Clp protease adapter protein ClpS
MSETVTTPRGKVRAKTERPRLYKVILINDDFTPRTLGVIVLKGVPHSAHLRRNASRLVCRIAACEGTGDRV